MKKTIMMTMLAIASITAVSAENNNGNEGNGLGIRQVRVGEMKAEGMMKVMGTGSSTVDLQIKALNTEMETKIRAITAEYQVKIKAIIDANKPVRASTTASTTMKDFRNGMKEIKEEIKDARKEYKAGAEASTTIQIGAGFGDFFRSFMSRFAK